MSPDNTLLEHIGSLIPGNKLSPMRVTKQVRGGSINSCFQLRAGNEQTFFLKINEPDKYPGMLDAEKKGLNLLAEAGAPVPQVHSSGTWNNFQFLVLEWIEPAFNAPVSQQLLGIHLAELHIHTAPNYGLDHNNYMGSLFQRNVKAQTLTEFFICSRLIPQVKLAIDGKLMDQSLAKCFEQLFSKFDTLYPVERPSLVHGDLWSGNYMITVDSEPVLIYPAAAYSHREIDLAMTRLFGGFSKEFYEGYSSVYPPEPGWQARVPLWNLYPLLVHLNLFGLGYIGQIRSALRNFV